MSTHIGTAINMAELTRYINLRITELGVDEYLGLRFLSQAKPVVVVSGLYRESEAALRDIALYAGKLQIYCSLNPVRFVDDLALNSLRTGGSFKDSDITRISRVLIDIDPERPSGLSSNEQELLLAYEVTQKVIRQLSEKEITFSTFMSGNGFQILIKVPSYSTIRSTEVHTFLKFLHGAASTSTAHVDISVSNASRICRVYGTLNIKGTPTIERPHRIAEQVLDEGEKIREHDILEIFKNEIGTYARRNISNVNLPNSIGSAFSAAESKGDYSIFKGDIHTLNIVALFKEEGLYCNSLGEQKHAVLCPNRAEHSQNTDGTSSTVIFEQQFIKWPGFVCSHNHCLHLKLDVLLRTYFDRERVDRHCFSEFRKILPASNGSRRKDEFNLISLRSLLSEPDEVLPYIVDGLLFEGGFSLLASKPKVGKTTMLRHLAMAVSKGEDFWRYKTKQGVVIYLGLEEHKAQMRREFQLLESEPNDNLLIHAACAPSEAIKKLEALIEKHQPVLVIIDTMHKLTRFEDGNSYAEVNLALEPLLNLARSYDCHVLCTHHLSKGLREADESILGSTAISGAFDTLIFLTKTGDERTVHTIQRYGESMEKHILRLDPFNRRLQLIGYQENRINDISRATFELLVKMPDGLSAPQIVKALGKRSESVARVLNDLVERQLLVRRGTGKKGSPCIYSIPAKSIPPLEGEVGNSNSQISTPNCDYIGEE